MSDAETSATTPLTALRSWASDWADSYDQTYRELVLEEFVGKRVTMTGEVDGEPKGGTFTIVGYSRDVLIFQVDDEDPESEGRVYRSSLITEDGLAVPIFAGMTIEEAPEE